jgi:hypothetical protein
LSGNLIVNQSNSPIPTGINAAIVGVTDGTSDLLRLMTGNPLTTKFLVAGNGNITGSGTLTGLTGVTSSGSITFSGLSTAGIVTNNASGVLSTTAILPVANGGTGSTAQNWVDLTNAQNVAGAKTWSGAGSFTAAGTGLAVTNNQTIGGTLSVTGTSTLTGVVTLGSNSTVASPVAGMIRWNSTTNDFEAYDGQLWMSMSGLNERSKIYTTDGY